MHSPRFHLPILVVFCLSLLFGCGSSSTPDEVNLPPAGFEAPRGDSLSDPSVLAQFAAEADEVYRLGAGDQLTIEVWDRPELSGGHVLGPDGQISLPLAGGLDLTGLTREEAAGLVTGELQPYFQELNVVVRVDEYVSNRVFVLGRVATPGEIRFEGSLSLLEAITRAGGLPIGGAGAEKAALTRCTVFRGRDRVAFIDLQSLLTGENLALNIPLLPSDLVYIPDAGDQLVYVLGDVHRPGAIHLTPGMSFLDALAEAGGPTEDAAPGRIQLVRESIGQSFEVDLRTMLEPVSGLNVALQKGDTIFVPRRGVAKAGYIIRQFAPVNGLILLFGVR